MINYSKYYDLESLIFDEVHRNFHKNQFLTAEEFFLIIIWKANRAKSKIARKFDTDKSLTVGVKKLTQSIYKTPTNKGKMKILINDYNFYLPMASAILSVLYPKDFSIYDIRVCDILKATYNDKSKKINDEFS